MDGGNVDVTTLPDVRSAADTAPGTDVSTTRVCSSGETTCEGTTLRVCSSDGRSFEEFECGAAQGLRCEGNVCRGACSPTALGTSYVGCDYYPTVTANPVFGAFAFGVAVANTDSQPADITVSRAGAVITTRTIAPGAVETIELDWVRELKGADWSVGTTPQTVNTTLVAGGAYRLQSTRPITVYQYSPTKYSIAPAPTGCPETRPPPGGGPATCFSYSNDASLLFPANAWANDYQVASWPATGGQAFFAVTATRNGTRVRIDSRAGAMATAGGGIDANGDGEVVLNAGDVLQVTGAKRDPRDAGGGFGQPGRYGPDLTGALVSADGPIQVVAGNSCGDAPTPDYAYCDHLEESLFPNVALGTEYIAGTFAPARPHATGKFSLRLVAAQDDTTITFNPPVKSATDGSVTNTVTLAARGDFFEGRFIEADTRVSGTHPFVAMQYMLGSTANGLIQNEPFGDPSQVLLAPVRQFRDSYVFFSSNTYDTNWVTIVARTGTRVTLDGVEVSQSEYTALGASGFALARVRLTGERHAMSASTPFGITVYGYGIYTSYAYPGGTNLIQAPF